MRAEPVDPDAALVEAIAREGVAVVPRFIDDDLVARLRARSSLLDASEEFLQAGIGHGATRVLDPRIRGDLIRWIDLPSDDPAEDALARALDDVRQAVNRSLALGAFELEMHYAIYPPGAGYARHRDRFGDDDARVLSCVVYLNDAWRDEDGGALRLHVAGRPRDVMPRGGTLVAFLADRVEHEVLTAGRERLAVAAWFRRRAASG
jgi:SM-20-related protein